MAAESQSVQRLMRLALPQALGWSIGQALDSARSLGAIRCTYTKFAKINSPAIANVQFLCRENVISQGTDETTEATVAPSPIRTNREGNAQHSNVLNDVNSEMYPRNPPFLDARDLTSVVGRATATAISVSL